MPETLVIALGGNAITRPDEPGTIPKQFEQVSELPLLPSGKVDRRTLTTRAANTRDID